ncbi:ATP-binding protein [Virgisporangium ochraceum]|uniref:Orc1-like AAA ATPase domain-containing protein n=1 Tax=Virgisporangium ochraceum TaxID=65505 RepID=A0A8J3ZTK6_9ACTN|nr:ATP-binding protein [Virgisporangium ochraceum]GIJ67236.1 hypothetical protein Voc01_021530 [Virgisporangium ochraceum]
MIGGFVGRARELAVLETAQLVVRNGDSCVVVVTGEPGIGKTRLCREVVTRADRAGFAVAWGSCWPDGGAPPLWPWQPMLSSLGADPAIELPSDPQGPGVGPERFARFSAVADLIASACGRSPVLLVIDDAHAADPGAMLLARFVARALVRQPVLLLLSSRIADRPVWTDSDATFVPLGPFDVTETAEFLRSRGGNAPAAAETRALHRLTGGHPLHLHHAVRAGTAHTSIRTVIDRALAGLAPDTARVLRFAAVLGAGPAVADVATVAGAPAAAVRAALAEASLAGLVDVEDVERFAFGHELVREVLHEQLPIQDRVDAHARAAAALRATASARSDRLARYAHHALGAASRSREDAENAVTACRDAARALVAGSAYEQAAALLGQACAVHEAARLASPLAPLLVERADAVLQCGLLTAARRLYQWTATTADAERDPVTLARAAVGIGGVWVNEHRSRLDWERVVGLQRRALAGLPETEPVLRQRLVTRLAVEDVYRGGPIAPALDALSATRRLGDGVALAEALSLCHHALLSPPHAHTRPALADEQIAVASAAGAGMLALVGLCWRTVDAFHLGDPRATQMLAELRERCDVLGCRSILFIVESIEVMLLIRAGRLDEAEARAGACLSLGDEVGDADALGVYGAHLLTIRFIQGRDAELVDTAIEIAASPTLNPAEFSFLATAAGLAVRAGDLARARTMLDQVTAPGLATLPQSSTWLVGMYSLADAAHGIGDAALARQVEELVEPYAALPLTPSLAVTCLGSAERILGLTHLTRGDLDGAVAAFERAVDATRLLGNRPLTAVNSADLAAVLVARNASGDRVRAAELLTFAHAEATTMGLDRRAARWAQTLAGLTEPVASIVRTGRQWVLTADALRAVVPDRVGVRYLARLLTSPGQPISALQLTGAADTLAGVGQPVLDERARGEYRRRVAELGRQATAAEAAGDAQGAESLRKELDALLDELRRSTGRGGRTRQFADAGERARTAVSKAIKRAVTEIREAEPALADLLDRTVTTGTTCVYTPDPARPVAWTG